MTSEAEGGDGGVPVGRRVVMPRGAQAPYKVFVNGVEQAPGTDYEVHGREIVFARPIVKEGKLGFWRWLAIFLGLFGSYRRNETVDVEYRAEGRAHLLSDVDVVE